MVVLDKFDCILDELYYTGCDKLVIISHHIYVDGSHYMGCGEFVVLS